MRPTYQMVHIDVPLTNISIAYTPGEYIGAQVFPMLPVVHISDKYFTFTKGDWLRNEVGVRAPGTRAPRGDYGITTANYICTEKAIAKAVPDEITQNADMPLKPLEDATRWVTEQLYQKMDIDVSAVAFGTTWSGSASPGSGLWSLDTSDPLGDIMTAYNGVLSTIFRRPNRGVIGFGAWRYLYNHPDVVDRIKYNATNTDPAVVALQAVAALAGLNSILVGTSGQDTALDQATASLGYIWGVHFLAEWVPPGPSLLAPSAGYIFTYINRQISRFREDQNRADIVEGRWNYTVVQPAADAGYLIKTVA